MKKIFPISIFIFLLLIPIAKADEGYYPEFLNFFLSEFFLTTLVAITIAGYLGYLTKSGLAFAVSLIILLTILTFAGVYPFWLLIIITLISGMVIYVIHKREGEGK